MTLRTPAFNDARTYGFEWLRLSNELVLQEGVVGANDFKVTAAAAGLQRVDVASGIALVKGDSGVPGTGLSQGLYVAVNDASIANAVTLNASNGTNPRLDQIILRVLDTADLGSASDSCVIDFVTGTATAGATLDNRTGAGALPNDAIRLADVLVPAGSTAVTAGNVRDRRPWARGAYQTKIVTDGDISVTGTSYGVGGTALANTLVRLETAGGPVRVEVTARVESPDAINTHMVPWLDGAIPAGLTDLVVVGADIASSTLNVGAMYAWTFTPAAGSHTYQLAPRISTAGTATIRANATQGLVWTIQEIARPNAVNG